MDRARGRTLLGDRRRHRLTPRSANRMVEAVADEGLDGIVLNVGIGMGGGLRGTSADRLGHDVRREPARPLPRRARRAPATRRRQQHRLHQLGRRPQAGQPASGVRRVEGGDHRAVPSRRARRRAPRRPGQRRRARADRHTARTGGFGGPAVARAHAGPARPPGHGVGGRRGHGLPACRTTRATSPARRWRSMAV